MKVASTINIVNAIKVFEEMYGPGVILSIKTVTSEPRSIEYVIKAKDIHGKEHLINIPSIEEEAFWEVVTARGKN